MQQQTLPMTEAGCEGKADRSVSWTALCAGFAKFRSRAELYEKEAKEWVRRYEAIGDNDAASEYRALTIAYRRTQRWLDDLETYAKDASKAGSPEGNLDGPSS
jgi:hypothetical protein